MNFQTRAKLADADVWAAIVAQVGTLTDPDDIEAVISGTMAAIYRLIHRTQVDPDPAVTVELIRAVAAKISAGEDD
jgi:hypothetical protein